MILLKRINVMLTNNIEFYDNIDSLRERERKAKSIRAKNPKRFKYLSWWRKSL